MMREILTSWREIEVPLLQKNICGSVRHAHRSCDSAFGIYVSP